MDTAIDAERVPTTTPLSRHEALTSAIAPLTCLSVRRLNLMRAGYLLIGVGLAVTKWPQLPGAAALPLMNGIVLSILTAMSVLAFVGLRYPIRMLPLLVFESGWKLLWLAAVGLPRVIAGDLDAEFGQTLFSVLLVVVVIAVTPWRHVWRLLTAAPGDPWR